MSAAPDAPPYARSDPRTPLHETWNLFNGGAPLAFLVRDPPTRRCGGGRRESGRGRDPGHLARSVLVVDDDADVRDLISDVLAHLGHAVVTAANGRAALEWLKANEPPCLILLDLEMPLMDGWQFLAARALDPGLSAVPVLVVSSRGHEAQADALNATACLQKPFAIAKLVAAVERHCGRSTPGRPA